MEHRVSTCKVLCQCFLVVILFLSFRVSAQSPPLNVVFTETPSNVTSRTNATFGFTVVDTNGTNPCSAAQNCSFTCQLDQSPVNCVTGRASVSNLKDGTHNFSVAVNSSSRASGASEFSWTIDTVAPTAVVDAAQAFTNAENVTVNITFSEICEGFVCTNSSFCDLWVYGAGAVIPSTLKELEKGRRYALDVALSTAVPTGKVDAVIARSACADAAGNLLQRTNQSSSVIRFNRTVPSVNLWTAIPSSEVIINNQPRTCEATNKASDLRIYLDFDSPVTSSAKELLGFLSVSSGNLTATARKSVGNRRFGYRLSNVTSASEVTVALAGNAVSNRYGALVPSNSSRTFLYDTFRPQVQVSTTSRAKTKDATLPFVVQFTEAIFGFNSSSVIVSGGSLTSFIEVDRSTYSLEVTATNNNLVTVTVPENSTLDVAGNPNFGSSSAQIRHYSVPAISVVLYCLITVGLLLTALVSGILSVASATLAAAGAISHKRVGDPSRNLLGLTCNLQVLALSGFLAVSLPVEYQEVTNGLRWLIPHVRTPWQSKSATSTNTSSSTSLTNASTMLQHMIGGRRRLLALDEQIGVQHTTHRGRALGANVTLYGLPLGPGDYQHYFLNQVSDQAALKSVVNDNGYNGWQEFQRNMFWIGVVGGGLILIHILMVLFLRWRTRAPIRGALTIPRFELYLLILFIPGLCQASAFVIRGGSPLGIAIGGLLLAVPSAFLISILIFLIYGVFMGALVQYREYRYEVHRHGYVQPQKAHGLINLVAGTGFPGKWVRNSRLAPWFLPRYGLIFEDHKGPPVILVHKQPQSLRHRIKRSGSTTKDGDSEVSSNDVVQVSDAHRILGDARAAYILVDLSRRIILGLVFGFFPESDHAWSQVGVVLGVTAVQLVYLVVVKPFRRRGVQVVETIALLCELGVFVAAVALLAKGNPTDLNHGVGIFMLALLVFSFVAQLVNEWYALLEQLMRLSTAQEPSLNDGLKKLAGGLVLPFTPRHTWGRIIGPQAPQRAPSSAAVSKRRSNSPPYEIKPFPLPNPDSVVPPSSLNPNPNLNPSVAQIIAIDVDSGPPTSASEEIQPEPSPRSDRQISRSTQRGSIFSAEGRRSRGGSHRETDSQELKILRELARASFPRNPKDADHDIEHGGAGSSTSGIQTSSAPVAPVISPREGDEKRYVRKRRQFQGMPQGPTRSSGSSNTASADSISVATPEIGDLVLHDVPLSMPEMAHLVSPSTMSIPSPNKIRPGYVESHSMNVRDASLGSIRPLEER